MKDETKPMPDEIVISYLKMAVESWAGAHEKYELLRGIDRLLSQPQGETIEALLARVPEKALASFFYNSFDEVWICTIATYKQDIYGNGTEGIGKTPTEALKSALSKAGG